MIFNNISKEVKMEVLQDGLSDCEKNVYQNLIKLGIDPEEFDLDSYDKDSLGIDENNSTLLHISTVLEKDIETLKMINREISLLG